MVGSLQISLQITLNKYNSNSDALKGMRDPCDDPIPRVPHIGTLRT